MNTAAQTQSYSPEAMVEHAKRQARFTEWFNPHKLIVDSEIDTYGILLRGEESRDSRVTITQSLNPRIKTPCGLIVVNDVYRLVTYNLRHDIWKYWKKPFIDQPLPQINPLDYINDALQRRGVAEVVSSGVRGSRITSKDGSRFAFGFGGQIAAFINVVLPETTADEEAMFARHAQRVDYHGAVYYVKVPHALEAGRPVQSFSAFAYGIVPLIHAYRTADDRSLADE